MVFGFAHHVRFSLPGPRSRRSRKRKKILATELGCPTSTPRLRRGQGTEPTARARPSRPPRTTPSTRPRRTLRRSSAHLSPPPPGPEGPVVTSPEATMRRHLEGNVVFRETAKSGDCIKVNTIYLHLLSLGLTKGHHRQAHPPAQL